jgi:hypothetical protein
MQTRTKNVFTFEELSEEAKEKAIVNLYDVNVDYEWYADDCIFEEIAKDYGIGINMAEVSFDLGRNCYIAFYTYNHSKSEKWQNPIVLLDAKKFCKKSRREIQQGR